MKYFFAGIVFSGLLAGVIYLVSHQPTGSISDLVGPQFQKVKDRNK